MKLTIQENGNLKSLFPREEEPSIIEDKVQCYDLKKLEQWEKTYNEIRIILDGPDHQKGMELLFELAEEGYPEARLLLSDMYIEGKDLPESFQKAVEWDRRARYAEKFFRQKI